jgi:hypothetical protein
MYKQSLLMVFCLLAVSLFSSDTHNQNTNAETSLLVHKTLTCGCCKMWVEHLKMNGLNANTQDHENLDEIKKMYDIKPQYRSCHTAVSKDGYIFEGHIPSRYITQFLSENHPNAIGLSVPGMPLGSPGMEVGNRFMAYDVLILFKDGTSNVYAEIRGK